MMLRGFSKASLTHVGPGLALTTAIAIAAVAARNIPGLGLFNAMVLGLAIGIAWQNLVGTPARARAGVLFSQRQILRFAIVLLGLQITASDVIAVGVAGLAIIVVTLGSTFVATIWLGRRMDVDPRLAELIAAGTSICGASAIVATNAVTRARDEDVAYAVACITVCGSVAIFVFPPLSSLLNLTDLDYGLWAGSSIHEIAQVVAAAFQGGPVAGAHATIVKLTRVLMLGPMVIALSLYAAKRRASAEGQARARPQFPWFVVGFLALAAINSAVSIPPQATHGLMIATSFLLAIALSAFGLEVDAKRLRAEGYRPFLLCVVSSLFIAGLSLALISLAD